LGCEKKFSQKAFRAWAAAVLAAATLVYSGTLSYPFLHDDITVIALNPTVQEKGRALEAFSADYWGMRGGDSQRDRLYRPLTTLTLVANHALGGNAPAGYRIFNILMHALVSFLLLLLGLRIGLSLEGAGAAAFLFALHPVHTEAVNAVVGRSDLLAAAGVLAGMAVLMSGAFGIGESGGREKNPDRLPLLAALLFALALLSKESGAALILWAGIWWAWRRAAGAGRMNGEILRRSALALGAVLAAYVAMRYWALGMLVRPVPPSLLDNVLAHEGAAGRIIGALGVLGRYFGLLVWPWPLTIDYSYSQILPAGGASALWAAFGAGSLAAWGAAAWRWRSDRPEVAFGLGLFLAAYFPASNLAVPIGTVMAERLMYIPSAGFLLALVPAAAEFSGRRGGRAFMGTLAVVALIFAGMSWARNREWSDYLIFWKRAAEVSPNSARALRIYGQSLSRRGRFAEAVAPLRKSVRIMPVYDPAWTDLGIALMQSRQEAEAEKALKESLRLHPRSPESLLALGALYLGTNRLAEGRTHLEKAVRLYPKFIEVHFRLGNLYMREGENAKAAAQYRAALSQAPGRGDIHHNLALVLFVSGDIPGARRHAMQAERLGVRLRPGLARMIGLPSLR
jgi:Flp pilus assembly protein TadD